MPVTEHDIRRRTGNLVSISQPADFVLDVGRPVERSRAFDPDVSPYCFDFEDRTLLCVSTPDISGATFFYQAQRLQARTAIKVPLDTLPAPPESPTLMFSIGRCGSTLLHKAFRAAGLRSVSEPDFFTQAATGRDRAPDLPEIVGRAARLLRADVIKLRAECNQAPLLIAGAFRSPRVMFVLRDPVDWAASLRRLSRNTTSPAAAASWLHSGLVALECLAQRFPVRVCYYEDFRGLTARYVNDLVAWMEGTGRLRPALATELAARDAQQGSVVSRESVRDVPDDPAFRDAFRAEWSRARPAALIERLRLRRL